MSMSAAKSRYTTASFIAMPRSTSSDVARIAALRQPGKDCAARTVEHATAFFSRHVFRLQQLGALPSSGPTSIIALQ